MVLDRIRSLVSGENFSDQKKYEQILKNLSLDKDNPENQIDIDLIKKGFDVGYTAHEGQLRKSGEPYFTHCAAVGIILSEWKMDAWTISAGLMHDVIEDTKATREDVVEKFGEVIAELVDGVSKLSDIKFSSRREKQAENFMKMFLSVAKDLRVIIIKFADRLGEKIWSLREILLVAFFVSLGMKLNLNQEIILNSFFLILLLVVKFLSLFFLLIFFNLRAYSSFLISISLITYSEFMNILGNN